MRILLRHFVLTASLLTHQTAWSAGPDLCRDIFANTKKDGSEELRINDFLRVKATSPLTRDFRSEFESIFQILENQYGPLPMKQTAFREQQGVRWNWTEVKDSFLRRTEEAKSVQEQYYLISEFFSGLNDAHVSSSLPSTLIKRLPVQLMAADGRLFINFANFDSFPSGVRKPVSGDEVLAINGQKPFDFQKQAPTWNADGNPLTSQSMFGLTFGFWSEARGIPLSKMNFDSVQLTVRSRKTNEVYDITLPFRTEGIGLIGKDGAKTGQTPPPLFPDAPSLGIAHMTGASRLFDKVHQLFNAKKPVPFLGNGKNSAQSTNRPMRIGEVEPFFKLPDHFKRIEFPALTESVIFAPKDLMAGTFEHNGKRVGFLRVPSYSPENLQSAILTLRYLIAQLQKSSDYLIIDQTNNPGGAVVYSDLLIKSLVGKHDGTKHMRFAVKPSQKFMRQYAEIRAEIEKNGNQLFNETELKTLLTKIDREFKKIQIAYQEGNSLSEPISMLPITEFFERSIDRAIAAQTIGPVSLRGALRAYTGVDLTQNQVYTKPVYMMINEFDFSGGDATPAGFSDYSRGRLIGTRTAGAGGTVENFSHRGVHEFDFSLTTSLMVRKDGVLVENYGVHPDIEMPLLASDIADGYTTYFDRILKAVDQDMLFSMPRN